MADTGSKSNHASDAVVLLTGGHVDELVAALRAVNVVNVRLEESNKSIIKSNATLEASNHAVVKSNKELVEELKKGRRQGEKDRRKGGR